MSFVLTAQGLSFELPNGQILFKNLNISLGSRKTALIGINGVGKSTLARILSKEFPPTAGQVLCNGTLKYLRQFIAAPDLSVGEYLGDEISYSQYSMELLKNIDLSLSCRHLSGGEWVRVQLASIESLEFFVLDEPTNNLDQESRGILFRFLRQHSGGYLIISHDRECLGLCDEILELSNKGLTHFSGSFADFQIQNRQLIERLEGDLSKAKQEREKAFEDRQTQISRQEERNQAGKKAGLKGGMPKILLGARKRNAQVTTGKIDESTLERAQEKVAETYEAFENQKLQPKMYFDLHTEKISSKRLLYEANDFNVFLGERWIFRQNLNFHWQGSLRLSLKGPNGSGKSTLLKYLMGEQFQHQGILKQGLIKSYFIDQKYSHLDRNKTLLECIQDACHLDESEARTGLAEFLFKGDQVFQKIDTLSGGELLRASLAHGFLRKDKPDLLILDEPTNNLDLLNIEYLEGTLREYKGALIVVSHDPDFIKSCELTEELDLGFSDS